MSEIELEIGDVVQIGDYTLTVVDVADGEATFRLDQVDEAASSLVTLSENTLPR